MESLLFSPALPGSDQRISLFLGISQAFRTRWELVNAAERAELQATPLDRKLHQLAALMASVEPFGWMEALAAEESQVRARWNRLRAIFHG